MILNPTTEKFVLHWGEMGTQWGVNRSVAQIHALLFILGKPMNAAAAMAMLAEQDEGLVPEGGSQPVVPPGGIEPPIRP